MKVRIGNSQDFVEQEFATQAEATAFLQTNGVVLKQALKALAVAVPITVSTQTNPATGAGTQQVERPVQPARQQGTEAEVCPNCGKKTLYTNITGANKKDGTPNPNAGKKYKRCSNKGCIDAKTGKAYFDPFECSRWGNK